MVNAAAAFGDITAAALNGGYMMDLINRTELLRQLDKCIAEGDAQTPITNAVLIAVRCAVASMPKVDAVPVRHGHWMNLENGNATCSECGKTFRDVYDFDNADAYCRHCGAKMDEGAEE